MNLCFDARGQFIPFGERTQTLTNFYADDAQTQRQSVNQILRSSGGVTCITPQMRYERLCVTESKAVIPGVINDQEVQVGQTVGGSKVVFCYSKNPANGVYEQFASSNYDVRQKIAEASEMLRQAATYVGVLSGISNIIGINGVAQTLNDFRLNLERTASLLFQLSTTDLFHIPNPECVLEDFNNSLSVGGETGDENSIACLMEHAADNTLYLDHLQEIIGYIRKVETGLNNLKRSIPNAGNIQAIRWASNAIDFVKTVLGMHHNITWITIGNDLPLGVDIHPGDEFSTGPGIIAVQHALVELGLLDPLSATGELDLVTQQAISAFQNANGLSAAVSIDQVFLSSETLALLGNIVQTADGIYGDDQIATIDDFFTEPAQLGSFNNQVQMLQIILYVNGYNISSLDGVFDSEVCSALQSYQADNNLEIADSTECTISTETMNQLNGTITQNDYLGSGFEISTNGALNGTGSFLGITGPGIANFGVNTAEARGLNEGDTILMYTFLDEETILITTHDSVITEIIRRRSLDNIFNNQ